jgi:hypothetical protein
MQVACGDTAIVLKVGEEEPGSVTKTMRGQRILESAYFVSLMFCVLDNNIRNFKCVLSGADFTAQDMAKSLGWRLPVPGRIIRPGAGYSVLPARHQKNG